MPEEKINLINADIKVNSVNGYNPVIIKAEYTGIELEFYLSKAK